MATELVSQLRVGFAFQPVAPGGKVLGIALFVRHGIEHVDRKRECRILKKYKMH